MAPGGPPEGQCKKEQETICDTNIDDPFRTRDSPDKKQQVNDPNVVYALEEPKR